VHARSLRWVWLFTLVSLLALTLPIRGEMQQPVHSAKPGCCARMHMPAADSLDAHCRHEPAKPPQCCAACAAGLSLMIVSPVRFVFSRNGGETLVNSFVQETSRADQPPIPPPRV
jgi:hypothetical protein